MFDPYGYGKKILVTYITSRRKCANEFMTEEDIDSYFDIDTLRTTNVIKT